MITVKTVADRNHVNPETLRIYLSTLNKML